MLYPIVVGCAWGVSYNYISNKLALLDRRIFHFLFLIIFFMSWLGSKLLFLLTVPTNQVLHNRLDFWSGGGFVFYGGLIQAAIVVLVLYLSNLKIKNHLDLYSREYIAALLLGHAVGRIGCFLVGCCYGIAVNQVVLPVQLIESVALFILFKRMPKNKNLFQNIKWYFVSYAVLRFVLEFLRADPERGVIGIFSTSQFISLVILTIIILLRFKPRVL
jgi:phosphatidylglycerol:prolipoprotein diacylglycerol transferase